MKILGRYKNGNYVVTILDDGTKIKDNGDATEFIAEKPECMDVKITNMCDMGCPFCHENSLKNGKHGDILHVKFLDTLLPFTELAIGGGNPLEHPDLISFLKLCKSKRLICNMTVNENHFMKHFDMLKELCDNKLIYGLGVSLTKVTDNFLNLIKTLPNAVIHIINGVQSITEIKKLYDKNLKVLILGFKDFRRGVSYHEGNKSVDVIKNDLYNELPNMLKHMKVVSFDNLALKQLECKRLLSEDDWNKYYLGDDGTSSMFIDLVENKFSMSSTTPLEKRHDLLIDIKPMFDIVKAESKQLI